MSVKNTLDTQDDNEEVISTEPFTTYKEVKIGKTVYQLTSVFLGKFTLQSALEDLAVRRALQSINSSQESDSHR